MNVTGTRCSQARCVIATAFVVVGLPLVLLGWACSAGHHELGMPTKTWAADAGTTVVGPPADHTTLKRGVPHRPGYKHPIERGCPTCHGADLVGSGGAPSCFQCHGKKWKQ